MKYKLLLSDEAYLDIAQAIDYYTKIPVENLESRFRTQLRNGIMYIQKYPLSLAIKYKGIRIFNLKDFPYQVHFLLVDQQIMIFAIFHEKIDPKSWQDRLDQLPPVS